MLKPIKQKTCTFLLHQPNTNACIRSMYEEYMFHCQHSLAVAAQGPGSPAHHWGLSCSCNRFHVQVFSSSQHGGVTIASPRAAVNYFILPTFILHVVGLACLWALWYYLRWAPEDSLPRPSIFLVRWAFSWLTVCWLTRRWIVSSGKSSSNSGGLRRLEPGVAIPWWPSKFLCESGTI